ncbi:MAG: hypothetical protein K5905_26210 [Roseibium sp.]|uniref:hypothetical protein n=1 Tax=Roseibium sp. TaxID=1936156 RepID=UPI00260DD3CB|nr:hypothetical protein [Roseibium sp.]MCV0428964.1 hypothetical protein [Roseibium sp.]
MLKRLLGDSVSLVFGNLETVFKVCGSWFVLQFGLMMAIQLGFGTTAQQAANPGAVLLLSLVMVAFALLSSASIGVAWHRFGLLRETPGIIHLKVGGLEVKFILKSLLLALIIVGISMVITIVQLLTGSAAITGVIAILFMIFAIPTFFRFSLILPATAVEHSLGLGEAYSISEGLGWRMFFATLILSVPFVLLSVLFQFFIEAAAGSLPIFLLQFKLLLLNVLLQIIVTVLGISVLTAGYRIAMERQGYGLDPSVFQ